eukprot:1329482-Pyramimonas_sp.AAC.1
MCASGRARSSPQLRLAQQPHPVADRGTGVTGGPSRRSRRFALVNNRCSDNEMWTVSAGNTAGGYEATIN